MEVPGLSSVDELPGDTSDDGLIDASLLPYADTDTDGILSSTDWDTFNDKLDPDGDGSSLTNVDAATGDSATGFFDAGTLEHERGGLEANVSAYTGIVGIYGGTTIEVDTPAELELYAGLGAFFSDYAGTANATAFRSAVGAASTTHKATHAVGGTDTIFPADPDANGPLVWNDTGGALAWYDWTSLATDNGLGIITGDNLTTISNDADDDTINEYLTAINDTIAGLPGGHDAVTLTAGTDALSIDGSQVITVNAAVEELAEGTLADSTALGLDTGATYTHYGAAGDNSLNEMFASIDVGFDVLADDTEIGLN